MDSLVNAESPCARIRQVGRPQGSIAQSLRDGESAAVQFGIREQDELQNMWDDPVLHAFAHSDLAQDTGLIDTTIHTPVGDIVAPPGTGDVTVLDNRIAIAKNAFNFMYEHLYLPHNPDTWGKVDQVLESRLTASPPPQTSWWSTWHDKI